MESIYHVSGGRAVDLTELSNEIFGRWSLCGPLRTASGSLKPIISNNDGFDSLNNIG